MYLKTYQEFAKVPLYRAALLSSVLASVLDSFFSSGQAYPQQLQAYILLALQPQRKDCLASRTARKSPQEGFHWLSVCHVLIPGQILWPGGSSAESESWAHPQSLEVMSAPKKPHRLRVRIGWLSQKRREWIPGRQGPQMPSHWVTKYKAVPLPLSTSHFPPRSTSTHRLVI